jgi:glucose dehydrogenase
VFGGTNFMSPSYDPAHEAVFRVAREACMVYVSQPKWELRHDSPSWAGVLSTAGGVVFTGTNEGDLVAADSRTGKALWRYQLPFLTPNP